MVTNHLVLGALAGLIISAAGMLYVRLRRAPKVQLFTQPGEGGEAMSASAATWMAYGSMLFMGPFLGVLAATVYGWLPARNAYLALALGLATRMSIGAILSRTAMAGAKVALNYLVALVFGLRLPRLAAG